MIWNDISSAPKDGTTVILCKATDADGKKLSRDSFSVFIQVASYWDGCGWVVYCSLPSEPRLHFDPTHWAHLPETP